MQLISPSLNLETAWPSIYPHTLSLSIASQSGLLDRQWRQIKSRDDLKKNDAKQLKMDWALHNFLAISVTSPCPESTINELRIKQWPIWTCDPSSFPWSYSDKETCLLLEGDVTVTPDGGKPVRFGVGDLVVFPQGMSCTWEVHKAVRKHYRFGD